MTNKTKIKIANAFYSKPRGVFLPLTSDDIVNRTKLAPNVAHNARHSMILGGLIVGNMHIGNVRGSTIYELTPSGRALVDEAQ
tara:strand:+ start:4350 stop:4598 length:249 start_codon:yes stop_codon:yes gene_type:complete